ncbi:MAG: hypothetical protein ABIF89_01815 [bacterium]
MVYTHTSMDAGTFRDGVEDVEVALKATSETKAITEARARWEEISTASIARWVAQKKTWAHPPASPAEQGPRNARVIYKISLQ